MKYLLLCFFFFSTFATASDIRAIDVLGVPFKIGLPSGYCDIEPNSRAARFLADHIKRMSTEGKIMRMASPCKSLEAFQAGTHPELHHYTFVLVAFDGSGKQIKEPMPRAQFLSDISGTPQRVGRKEIPGRMRSAMANPKAPNVVGVDDQAAYFIFHNQSQSRGKPLHVRALSAWTLVKELPIMIATNDEIIGESPKHDSAAIHQEFVNIILRENGG